MATRALLKLGHRRGDAAEVAQIELVGSEYDPNAGTADAVEAAEQPKGLRGRARAAVKKLQDEGAGEAEAKPKRARKSAKKDQSKRPFTPSRSPAGCQRRRHRRAASHDAAFSVF